MNESAPIQISLTPEFRRKVRTLAKKYRKIQSDLQPVLEQLQMGLLGDSTESTKQTPPELSHTNRISGIGYEVFKVRIRNSDIRKGKSAGYRLIYWMQSSTSIVLLDIYSKSEQENIEVAEIKQIISGFEQPSELIEDGE